MKTKRPALRTRAERQCKVIVQPKISHSSCRQSTILGDCEGFRWIIFRMSESGFEAKRIGIAEDLRGKSISLGQFPSFEDAEEAAMNDCLAVIFYGDAEDLLLKALQDFGASFGVAKTSAGAEC